ncbi:class III extradiol ring-cleavage dioxygenase [Massilia sp. TS11]|uniref:DODA-type extradiol aromatic ring-opening family dioxygenase n=1 Tax=Massilia sp. TS11 TaxID=2908003 RepID=UPI001EDC2DBC|nr:class III extradiol ring-cleavage dioxygenase [Massilia sp. TS11]MCG2585567.1 dioxygenase [Massilia sp. TS11]
MRTNFPTFFLSHGGGPWPWMQQEFGRTYDVLAQSLADLPRQLGATPDALLVVTAHWEAPQFMVSAGDAPGMIYDYGGFPPHTYQIRYPAPGEPALARRVQALAAAAGIPVGLDPARGFDHGTFSMLAPAYPEAQLPVVQLSLRQGLDPAEHLALGRALAPLRAEGIAILGSGLSYHNLRAFGPAGAQASAAFDAWLQQTMALAPAARTAALLDWEKAPAARQAHPREEHLLPLMVALGAAEQGAASTVYHERDFFGALTVSSFRFA